ncbi:MAG: cysteine peptidase family C39 domain-containing protein, partial [Pseudomonadota bacterium]|nr:cysteine peptidase family C39 domain-containing protein [Pseudomonadota bacterium]
MQTDPSAAEAAPPPDPGLACLAMLARFHGVSVEPTQLAHEFGHGQPFGVTEILLAAKKLGLKAKQVATSTDRLPTTPLPALALDRQQGFFILARFDDDQALIHDPASPRPESLSLEALQQRWSGDLILFTSRASLAGDLAKFDFT